MVQILSAGTLFMVDTLLDVNIHEQYDTQVRYILNFERNEKGDIELIELNLIEFSKITHLKPGLVCENVKQIDEFLSTYENTFGVDLRDLVSDKVEDYIDNLTGEELKLFVIKNVFNK